jgi:metal-sulfur cluster biosynthetic enzyme
MDNGIKSSLYQTVIERLRSVIDPETNVDVVRMRLVENLSADEDGRVNYNFHPSSPLCPIAVFLLQQIKQAVATVPGVTAQQIEVIGYVAAEELTRFINQETSK